MKRFKKWIAVALVVCLCAALASPATLASPGNGLFIEINPPGGGSVDYRISGALALYTSWPMPTATTPVMITLAAAPANNYTFDGWTKVASGTSTPYPSTQNVVIETYIQNDIDNNAYFVAKFKADFLVKYFANGGVNPPPMTSIYGNIAGQGGMTGPTSPDGQPAAFVNWNTKPDGTGTTYNPGDPIPQTLTVDDPLRLYAIWSFPITITYDANGGANPPSPVPGTTKIAQLGNMTGPTTPSDHRGTPVAKFLRWNTKPDGTGTNYAPSADIPDSTAGQNQLTLYAVWGYPKLNMGQTSQTYYPNNKLLTVNINIRAHDENNGWVAGVPVTFTASGTGVTLFTAQGTTDNNLVSMTLNITAESNATVVIRAMADNYLPADFTVRITEGSPSATYGQGSYDDSCAVVSLFGSGAPETQTLRAFRDGALKTNDLGLALTELYYDASPGFVAAMNALPPLKWLAKEEISRFAWILQALGV